MITKNISMPHPVLGVFGDFVDGTYSIKFRFYPDLENRKRVIDKIKVEIGNEYIRALFESQKINLVIKITCTATYKTWTSVGLNSIAINEDEIDQQIEIESFLMANCPIPNYNDSSFSEVFDGHTFSLEKGDIVGLTGAQKIVINKENEKLSLGSIFKFSKIGSEEGIQELHFDYDEDEIVINYPCRKDEINPVTLLFDKKTGLPYTALNLYIIPAMAEAFKIIQSDENSMYSDKKWFTVLEALLPPNEREEDCFINSQKTIKSDLPILLAFDEMFKKFK